MRPSSSLSSSTGGSTPLLGRRQSIADLKRPPSSRGFQSHSPKYLGTRSRPGSSLGSRPLTPVQRQEAYTGTVKVSIRPNPCSNSSLTKTPNWLIDEHSNAITNSADATSYVFDNVFPACSSVSNRSVYDKSCAHLVHSFLNDGFNCTLFAYGMTGSGKTYSMRGEEHDPGFVRLAIDDIFEKMGAESASKKHVLAVSYLEIYNEKIIDLLGQVPLAQLDLKIRDDPEYGTKIVGIHSPTVADKQQLLQLIKTGDAKRKTSATDYNARSSRSHAILQLRLHTVDKVARNEVRCTLSLCDLAGSERATSSAERRKEGAFINKSLLALSTVINKLSLLLTSAYISGMEHIPYRDSKLTRLLQPALSGLSLILILCTVHLGASLSAADQQIVTETNNTLRFAARAKDIVLDVSKNKKLALSSQDSARIIDELRQTVDAQKQQIHHLKLGQQFACASLPLGSMDEIPIDRIAMADLEAQIKVQNERIEHLNRLNDLQKTETILLRNDALNDILGVDIEKGSPQMMMSNLEEFYNRVNYEMEEHKAYISHLEKQLRSAHLKLASYNKPSVAQAPSEPHLQELLKEQEEEIWQLRETIKDKDHIIHSLTKTSKLRRLVDSSSTASSEFLKRPSLSAPVRALANKENNAPQDSDRNMSPARAALH
ncbi:kinesin-domain-containing protein [Metschnikowia bicuspidata var. bicuspidata NRRL YB-4993]|uniref:Kinesin-domain-containing protein n=1 Tax=Metschnikowia bicuspidata var. bicuspidata NRRL YB-4993 TaxID=869754 RepID=A0A1A0H9G4_9ASCO|nr:kinesin-domain-containing protein [Metschnikowia bicuspidata var. bicuspidata NRRL YB-4993]OBA20764.1 kinesin-domain-containing protein [Metschnikowia bicuspidata var. bicuspidata NRRL YB-4993]